MKYSKQQVQQFLPHRDPFLFIDSIEEIILPQGISASSLEKNNFKPLIGGKVIAHYFVQKDHAIFRGHFPGNPIFPGVTQIEMMAQASAFLSAECLQGNFENINLEVALLSVTEAKFRKKIIPDAHIIIETELILCRQFFQTHRVVCKHEGEVMSEATVMALLKYN